MKTIEGHPLGPDQAALWFHGQAGYLLRSGGVTAAIDPYLTDSAASNAPEFRRLFPPPITPEDLRVDLFLVSPRYVLPNHYDLMALNAENPETFRWFCQRRGLPAQCLTPTIMKPFVWGSQ